MRSYLPNRWSRFFLIGIWGSLFVLNSFSFADTIILKNGSAIDGTVISESDSEVVLQVGSLGTLRLQKDKISAVEKNRRTGEGPKKRGADKNRPQIGSDQEKSESLIQPRSSVKVPAKISSSLKTFLDSPLPELEGEQKLLVEQWIKDLQRQRVNYRTRAEKRLGEAGPRVVPLLQSVAQSQFVLARICALRILNQHPRYESMPAALAGLESEDPWVRKLSSELATKIIGSKQVFPWKETKSTSRRSRLKSEWSRWYRQQESLRVKIEAQREQQRESLKDRKNRG